MRIKVTSFYQDVSGNKVNAGEYESSDLKNNLASYLVQHGHAVVIDNGDYQVGVDMGSGDDKTVETVLNIVTGVIEDAVSATPKPRTRRKKKTS